MSLVWHLLAGVQAETQWTARTETLSAETEGWNLGFY